MGRGGEGEIRTRGRLAPTIVFKTITLNHYVTSPYVVLYQKMSLKSISGRHEEHSK